MSKWECKSCKWEGDEREVETKLYFAATQEEPAEYTAHCPSCGSTSIEEINIALCVSCESEIVQHEGEQCTECVTCQAEAIADEAKGH